MRENENFTESLEGLCKSLTTYVGSIVNENEAKRIRLEKEMEERTKLYLQSCHVLVDIQKNL